MSAELKGCPFCGGEAFIGETEDHVGQLYPTATCSVCHAEIAGKNEAEAIAAWNTRNQVSEDAVEAATIAFFNSVGAYLQSKPVRFGAPHDEIDFYAENVPDEDREAFRNGIRAAIAALPNEARNQELVEALTKCRDKFARYAIQHLAKAGKAEHGTKEWAERHSKASANNEMVRLCDATLAREASR